MNNMTHDEVKKQESNDWRKEWKTLLPKLSVEGKLKKGKEKKEECFEHDFKHLKRFGRADWRCPKCGENVMLLLVFAADAGVDLTQ